MIQYCLRGWLNLNQICNKQTKEYIIRPKEIVTDVLRINFAIDPYLFTTIIRKVAFEIEIIHSMIFSLEV
jgi:hypothetical protein